MKQNVKKYFASLVIPQYSGDNANLASNLGIENQVASFQLALKIAALGAFCAKNVAQKSNYFTQMSHAGNNVSLYRF
jgi:hypothetical protein